MTVRGFREWNASLSAGGQFIVTALLVGVIVLIASAVRGHPSIAVAGVVGLVVSALFTPVAIARRKAVSGLRLVLEVSAAIKVGKVPKSLDYNRWTAELDRRSRWTRQFLAFGIVMVLVGGGFVAAAVLDAPQRLAHILSAVLFAGAGGYLIVSSLLQLPRIRRLAVAVAARATRR